MDLIREMLKVLDRLPANTPVKFLHKIFEENEKFVFILGDVRYALVKHDGNCYMKMNKTIQHISPGVFRETVDSLKSNQVKFC
jgi:hypothetical protein